MGAQPLQLSNYQDDPRGRRYTMDDRERTYLVWRLAGRRSFTKTAELTDIAVNTIRNWHKEDGWADRSDTEDRENLEMVKVALAAGIVDEATKSLETITAIRDDTTAPHKVRLDAAIWTMGVLGVSPIAKTSVLDKPPAPAPIVDVVPPLEPGEVTREQLMERERIRRQSRSRPDA